MFVLSVSNTPKSHSRASRFIGILQDPLTSWPRSGVKHVTLAELLWAGAVEAAFCRLVLAPAASQYQLDIRQNRRSGGAQSGLEDGTAAAAAPLRRLSLEDDIGHARRSGRDAPSHA